MIRGLDASSRETVEALAEAVRSVIGDEWLAGDGLRQISGENAPPALQAGRNLISTLARLKDLLATYPAGVSEGDVQGILQLAMTGHVVRRVSSLPGAGRKRKELRDRARAGQFDAFFDTLFECEVAAYVHEQMQPSSVRFVEGHHPDVLVTFHLSGRDIEVPVECKRIEPFEPRGQELDRLAREVDSRLVARPLGPLKTVISLHRRVRDSDADDLYTIIRQLFERTAGVSWVTAAGSGGDFQVSLARMETEFVRETAVVEDVPAEGSLIVRAETIHEGTPQDPRRIKWVIRVRSDELPNRIGRFEANLNKGIDQLTQSLTSRATGAVAIRIRPPRGLGDLYEADGIVRRVLRDSGAEHPGVVMLFWNDAERHEAEKEINADGTWQREVVIGYSLKPYFVANPASPLRFDTIDSRPRYFPPGAEPVVRDPATGEIRPARSHVLGGADDPAVATDPQALTEDTDTATVYMRLANPLTVETAGRWPGAVRAGSRSFVGWLEPQLEARFVEMGAGVVVRVATLDMRAWMGQTELLFWFRWFPDRFELGSPDPGGHEVWARAVGVRGVFL